MFKKLCGVFILMGIASCAYAVPISISQQQNITADGQLFNFIFSPLQSSDGTGGQFSITLDGDYSPRDAPPPLKEGSTVSLDVAGGLIELYNDNSGGNGIGTNTIAGLTLSSFSKAGGGNSYTLDWVFDMSSVLLNTLLADNAISVAAQNTTDVNAAFAEFQFVRVGFDYDSAQVPEPTTLALMGLGLAGIGWKRRKAA